MRRYQSLVADSARWADFEFREGDIVISTPAKCGTTWTQMMCALLIFQTPDLPAPLTDLSPWLDILTAKVDNVFDQLARQQHRRFIKSHTPFDGLPHDDRVTYISVGRDPRDVAISWDHHFSNMNLEVLLNARGAAVGLDDLADVMANMPPIPENPVDRFWMWIEYDEDDAAVSTLKEAINHLATFWDARHESNVILFHYSDLQADLDREMRRLADALGIGVDEELWPQLVEAATFDSMRGRAADLAPQVSIDGFWNDTSAFFRTGTSEQWRAFFQPGDETRYEKRIHELCSPDLAQWVHTGWHGSEVS